VRLRAVHLHNRRFQRLYGGRLDQCKSRLRQRQSDRRHGLHQHKSCADDHHRRQRQLLVHQCANGTYTITPSLANAIFSPVTESVTVNNNNLSATSFTANLSYSVSGTVAYTGAQTGQIYLAMNPTAPAVAVPRAPAFLPREHSPYEVCLR